MPATPQVKVKKDQGTAGVFMMGLLCGAAAGAAAGLLFAPKRGAELRGEIADSADGIRRQAVDAYGSVTRAVQDAVDRGRRSYEAGREAFQQARPEGNGIAHDVAAPLG